MRRAALAAIVVALLAVPARATQFLPPQQTITIQNRVGPTTGYNGTRIAEIRKKRTTAANMPDTLNYGGQAVMGIGTSTASGGNIKRAILTVDLAAAFAAVGVDFRYIQIDSSALGIYSTGASSAADTMLTGILLRGPVVIGVGTGRGGPAGSPIDSLGVTWNSIGFATNNDSLWYGSDLPAFTGGGADSAISILPRMAANPPDTSYIEYSGESARKLGKLANNVATSGDKLPGWFAIGTYAGGSADGDELVFDFTGPLRTLQWLMLKGYQNYGFVLRDYTESNVASSITFYSHGEDDILVGYSPRLRIWYRDWSQKFTLGADAGFGVP